MKNLKIGKKLLVTFGIIVAMLCLTVVVAVASLFEVRGNFTTFYENPYVINNYAMDMRRSMQNMAKYLGYAVMTDDIQQTADYVASAQEEAEALEAGMAFMKENFTGDMSLVNNFESSMASIKDDRERVFDLAKQNRNNEASKLFFDNVNPGLLEAQKCLQEISRIAQTDADDSYTSADSMAKMATVLLVLVAVGALILTIVLAAYLTRSLTRPIKEIEMVSNRMAEGDLKVQVQYTSKDELGALSDSIRKLGGNMNDIIGDVDYLLDEMANGNFVIQSKKSHGYVGDFSGILVSMRKLRDRLSNTLSQINESANQVASGSDQVSSGAQELSQGATEQASSVEELAATINDISNQVKETADNANEARQITEQTGDRVASSNQQMEEMIAAIRDISSKSEQIGKIIKTIEDIAFQTNILALNAAVEAARAGAAGKGFAVVADEVRNLASKSSEASKNTAVLIEDTVKAVEIGTGIANATAESLISVVEGATAVVSMVDKIAAAAEQQADSVAQVTLGIDQISSVVQNNSATAEESAAASEELSGQAQMLKDLISQFQLPSSRGMDRVSEAEVYSMPAESPLVFEADGKY